MYKVNGQTLYMVFETQNPDAVSHGETLKEAVDDLRFKQAERDPSAYDELTVDSELAFYDAVTCYRVITGACRAGVKDFLQRVGVAKRSYSIKEIIELTEDEYGGAKFKAKFAEVVK